MPGHTHSQMFESAFVALQTIVVLFLLLHDWVPLGRWNNVSAMRGEDSLGHRIFVTLLGGAPAAIGLYFTAKYFGQPSPHWLGMYLWIVYGIFLLGLLRAWWIPYLVQPDPERAARYRIIFAGTYKFLPERNGMTPDTLHTCFHVVTLATLVMAVMM